MRIVVDANLFASALIKPDSNPGRILQLVEQNRVELVLSPAIIKEIKRILLYPKISKYHRKSANQLDAYFEDILLFSLMVEGENIPDVIKADPTDNKYLACAREGEANYILSGDHHLLELGAHEGIPIIRASDFLSLLPLKKDM